MSFASPAIVLAGGGRFALALKGDFPADATLVIDLYDLANPVHPGGHLGWWQFDLDGDLHIEAAIVPAGQAFEIVVQGAEPIDLWTNPPVRATALAVNAVVRARTTNAILARDRVAAFADADALVAFRSTVGRDWMLPRFAPAGFLPSPGATVRIVSHDMVVRDAVGNLCFDVYRLLLQNGIEAALYATNFQPELNDVVRRIDRLADETAPDDTLLYFHSNHEPRLAVLAALPCRRRVAYFHGVTDPRLVQVFDPELGVQLRKGAEQMPLLAKFDLLAANSEASAARLRAAVGSERAIAIVPPKLIAAEGPADAALDQASRSPRLLTVGRVKSHKKIEDLLALFAAWLELRPDAECWIAGGIDDKPYRDYLAWVETSRLQLPPGKVRWWGSVDDAILAGLYRDAGVYVSMSEDEGFGLPILEAMLAGLPVLAYATPAIAELLGGTGVVFGDKDSTHLAANLERLMCDPRRLAAIVDRQQVRATAVTSGMDGTAFLGFLAQAIAAPPVSIADSADE